MIHLYKIYAFIFGLLIGSFLNVLIYRLPREINVVYPRSKCTQCGNLIKWYQNIPLISYVLLRGKCRTCSQKISFRYPLVEILTGFTSFYLFPDSLDLSVLGVYIFYFCIFCALLVHFFIDIEHKILPDSINIYLAFMFLLYSFFHFHWKHWVLGGAIGFLFPLFVTWGFYVLRGKIGLGGGDIKLYGALGIFLGPLGVIQNIFLSCLFGSLVGLTLILLGRMKKDTPLAFGPFIILVALAQIFFPDFLSGLFNTGF